MYLDDMKTFMAKLDLTKHEYGQVVTWCKQNIGNGAWWYAGTNSTGHIAHIEFDDEANMLLFILRWA
jgi:hypothetical protein